MQHANRTVLALTAALVAGSTAIGTTTAIASASARVPDAAHVTLTYWNGFTGPDGTTVSKLVNEFNKAHPNITVKMTIMPWDVFYEKLLPAFAAGTAPNIMDMDSEDLPQYAAKGVFLPLTSYYASRPNTAKYLEPGAVAGTKYNGTAYAVPDDYGPVMLYWNKTLFAKAGLSAPPKNWAQWMSDAVKLSHGGTSPQYGFAFGDNNTVPVWQILFWEDGGGVVNNNVTKGTFNSPGTVNAVEQWTKLIIHNGITPKNITGSDADSLFTAQKAAMEVNGPWATGGYTQAKINYGLAPVPAGPAKTTTLADVQDLSINAKDTPAQIAAAETFFDYWDSTSTQAYLDVNTSIAPVRSDVTASALAAEPQVALFEHAGAKAQPYELGTQFTNIDTDTVSPALEKIEDGAPIVPTLNAANQQINSYLSSASSK